MTTEIRGRCPFCGAEMDCAPGTDRAKCGRCGGVFSPVPTDAPGAGETAGQVLNQMTTWLYGHQYDRVLEKYDALASEGRFMDRARIHLFALCARRQAEDLDALAALGPGILREPEVRMARRLSRTPEDQALLEGLEHRANGAASARTAGGHRRYGIIGAVLALCLAAAAVFGLFRASSGSGGDDRVPVAGEPSANAVEDAALAIPLEMPTLAPIEAPKVTVAGFSYKADGMTYMTGDAITLNWRGDAGRYVVVLEGDDGSRAELGETEGRDFTVYTAQLAPGSYTARVGALPAGGSLADTAWGEARFAIPAPTPTPVPTPTMAPAPCTFRNYTIELAVREALGMPEGDLYPEDLARVVALSLRSRGLSDLSDLAMLTGLESLDLGDNTLSDLSPLAGLTGLQTLRLDGGYNVARVSVTDISPLSNLTALRELSLRGNRVTDAGPLAGLTGLEWLDLGYNDLRDITPLGGLTRLKHLALDFNGLRDAGPLAGLGALEWLDLGGNEIADIAPLGGLSALTGLRLDSNGLADLSPLAGLAGLESLSLRYNRVADVTPLGGLAALRTLDLRDNPLDDCTAVWFVEDLLAAPGLMPEPTPTAAP